MSDTRAALEEAYDQFDEEETDAVAETDEPETDAETDETEQEETETAAETDTPEVDEPDEEDELPTAAEAETETPVEDETDSETDAEPENIGSAPQGWRPEAREGWKDIPAAARAEIQRREQDIETKLGELSDRSRIANRFSEVVKPFEQTIALEANGDAIAATQNLMGVATRLRFGSAQEKAALVGQIVQQYGVDIEALDTALSQNLSPGGAPANPAASTFPVTPPATDPRVDQMWNQMQQQTQQTQEQHANEVEQFLSDPAREWAEDVRNDMADLIELAGRRGEALTLEQAYDRAVAVRPDIQAVINQRAQANAGQQQESLKRKRRAASQIRGGSATPAQDNAPATLGDALSRAWDDVANRD